MRKLWRKITARRDHHWLAGNFSDYVDGELDDAAARRAREHAQICPECTRVICTLQALLGAIGVAMAPQPGVGQRIVDEAMEARGH